jgi:hypothetical protein
MALGINFEGTSGGDILPIIKFDAKAGDFIRQDRVQDAAGQWVKNEEELTQPLKFAMDMATLEVGWLSFQSGAPDFRMVKVGEAVPTKPEGDFKSAFRVRIASKELGLREFSHSAKTVMKAMDQLHNQFEAEKGYNPDKVPVVEVSGTVPVKVNTPQGELRFKAPKWSIVAWVDKPELFNKTAAPEPVAPEPASPAALSEDDLF